MHWCCLFYPETLNQIKYVIIKVTMTATTLICMELRWTHTYPDTHLQANLELLISLVYCRWTMSGWGSSVCGVEGWTACSHNFNVSISNILGIKCTINKDALPCHHIQIVFPCNAAIRTWNVSRAMKTPRLTRHEIFKPTICHTLPRINHWFIPVFVSTVSFINTFCPSCANTDASSLFPLCSAKICNGLPPFSRICVYDCCKDVMECPLPKLHVMTIPPGLFRS